MAHDHAHCHAPTNFNRAFAIGIVLNLLFVIIEAGYDAISDSLALTADAGHNLSDVMTLLLAWGAMSLANRSATAKHTFGLKKGRYSPLSAAPSFSVSLSASLFGRPLADYISRCQCTA